MGRSNVMQEINDELGSLITEAKSTHVADVQEEVFRHKLLPLAVARYSNVDAEVELTHWTAITGETPYNGVKVFRGSKFLFETPPLILSPRVNFDNGGLLNQLKDAEANERNGLPKGDTMDSDKLNPSIEVPGLAKSLATWIHIFRLYGIKLVRVDGEEFEEVAPAIEVAPKSESWDDDEDGDIL